MRFFILPLFFILSSCTTGNPVLKRVSKTLNIKYIDNTPVRYIKDPEKIPFFPGDIISIDSSLEFKKVCTYNDLRFPYSEKEEVIENDVGLSYRGNENDYEEFNVILKKSSANLAKDTIVYLFIQNGKKIQLKTSFSPNANLDEETNISCLKELRTRFNSISFFEKLFFSYPRFYLVETIYIYDIEANLYSKIRAEAEKSEDLLKIKGKYYKKEKTEILGKEVLLGFNGNEIEENAILPIKTIYLIEKREKNYGLLQSKILEITEKHLREKKKLESIYLEKEGGLLKETENYRKESEKLREKIKHLRAENEQYSLKIQIKLAEAKFLKSVIRNLSGENDQNKEQLREKEEKLLKLETEIQTIKKEFSQKEKEFREVLMNDIDKELRFIQKINQSGEISPKEKNVLEKIQKDREVQKETIERLLPLQNYPIISPR